MLRKISNGIFILLTLVWIFVLFIDYMDKHPLHMRGFVVFKYFNFLLFLQLIGFGFFVIVQFINVDKIKRKFYNGFTVLLLVSVFSSAILFSFDNFVEESTTLAQLAYYLSRFLGFVTVLIILYSSVYVAGNFVLRRFFNKGNSFSLSICVGLMVIISAMFILASLHSLTLIPLSVLLLIPLVIGYKSFFACLKTILFTPFKDYKDISYWGFLVYYLNVVALVVNFLAILSPYPYGFDARNYYLNVTQLIAESGSLIPGFQPYSWQLFMSSGFILFDSHELAILISFSSFILVLIAINEFTKKIVKLNINLRLLILCILTCTPAIYNQLSIDVKIDFALLFFQIVLVHQFFKLMIKEERQLSFLILVGLLSGFALSIKFTHLYLIITLVIAYWAQKGSILGLLSSASLGVAIFLLAGIDDVGGLRSAHLGVNYQQWIIAFIGIILLIYIFVSNRKLLIKLVSFTMIFGAFHLIPVLPWATKNYLDTKSLSPKTLLIGDSPGFKTNFQKMNRIYKQSIDK